MLKELGVTLVELMITLLISALLVSIAFPSFTHSIAFPSLARLLSVWVGGRRFAAVLAVERYPV